MVPSPGERVGRQPPPNSTPLLEVRRLVKRFPVSRQGLMGHRYLTAVDDCSLRLEAQQTFALVGESGCGKTTLARLILRLEEPTGGTILFDGVDMATLRGPGLKHFRRAVQAVFQDPYSSLSPRLRVGDIIAEPFDVHEQPSRTQRGQRIEELLDQVGLEPAHARAFPHELSGGQRQRVAIARALSVRPRLVILDEPVSSLDVSIRAQILNLLSDLQEALGLAYLFISHDLAVVEHLSHWVGVMYMGKLVEVAPRDEVFGNPLHPYTQALIAAVPVPEPGRTWTAAVPTGEMASSLDPPHGCRFHPRCPLAQAVCGQVEPPLVEEGARHWAACHFVEQSGARARLLVQQYVAAPEHAPEHKGGTHGNPPG